MIISFKHRGLEHFFRTGSLKGIQAKHAERLRLQLTMLNIAKGATDLDVPGWNLHRLRGERQEFWSLKVSGNWRLIFRFQGTNVELVDYIDYH